MDVFNLAAKISLNTDDYNKQLGKAEGNFKSFGGKLKSGLGTAVKVGGAAAAAIGTATVAVTKSMASAISETAAYGDTVDKMSQKLGLSAEAYQEWDYVLKISGSDISSMSMGLKTLTNKFDDAKGGSDKAVETFKKLGLSMDDIKDLSREDLFEQVIYAFQDMEDSAERAALANDLFGRSGQELAPLFNTSAEETKKLIKQANELGGVMSNDSVKAAAAYEDSLTSMQTAISGLKHNVMSEFMPSVTTVMDGISELFTTGGTDKIAKGIGSFADKIGKVLPKVLDKGSQIISALLESILKKDNLDALTNGALKVVTTIASAIVKNIPQIISTLMDALPLLIEGVEQVFFGIVEALPQIVQIFSSALPELIPQLVTAVVSMAVFLMEHIDEIIQPIIDELPAIIQAIVTALMSNLPQLINGIISLYKALFDAQVQIITTVLPTILSPVLKWLGDVFTKVWKAISDFFSKIWNGISEAFGKAAQWVYDTIIKPVADFFRGLWEGIVSVFHTVIDPWIEIIKRAASLVYESVVKPVLDYFAKLWDDICAIWSKVSGWFSKNVIEPVKNLFSKIWESVKSKAKDAWEGIKNAFKPVADWFHDVFSKAWQKVKDVFSVGGKVFSGIKEGIEKTFKTVVNVIIDGINKIVAVPFKAINRMLEKLHNIEILGVKPFEWVHTFEVPEISKLKVDWHNKAYNSPYMFTKPTVMGFGDGNGGEIVYGHSNLMKDIAEAVKAAVGSMNNQSQVINLTALLELDGTTLARKTYQYNLSETERHGRSLVNA